MSESDVNAILIRLGVLEATVTGRLDTIAAENTKADGLHADHEARLRALEASNNQSAGVWRLLSAGGLIGGSLVAGLAAVLRAFGA